MKTMNMKKILMAVAVVAAMSALAESEPGYLLWMVDTTTNPDVGQFSYATVRESESADYLCFYNTSGENMGTDMAVAGYTAQNPFGYIAGPLYTGLFGDYADATYVFELWSEGDSGNTVVGHAAYGYSQLAPYVYSPLKVGAGNKALNVQVVPEPTSGLLALFAFAAMALKRKRV